MRRLLAIKPRLQIAVICDVDKIGTSCENRMLLHNAHFRESDEVLTSD